MVAVAHPDPPEEAQNHTHTTIGCAAHPPGARPAGAFAEHTNVMGMSFDVDPDEQYRDAHDTREPLFFSSSSHVGL